MKRPETARRQIVDYVRREMCRHGVSKLTMDDIAKGMKVSKRTLYQLFPQKTCLIRLCLSDIAGEVRGKLPDRPCQSVPACVKTLFLTVDGYITLLHTFGSTLLSDIVPDADYQPFLQWERTFWRDRLLDALNRCRTHDCLLPCVDPEIVADDLFRTLSEQCRQGASYPAQRTLCYVLLRGFFKQKEIGYIDEHLELNKLPA